MKIVVDTNVLVAGLLTPWGVCGQVVRLLTSGTISLCVDARILLEYEDVLHRPRFAIDARKADIVLEYVRKAATVYPTAPLAHRLPDPDDEAFLEVGIAAAAECLVTGNPRHFPTACTEGVRVLSPADFLEFLRKRVES